MRPRDTARAGWTRYGGLEVEYFGERLRRLRLEHGLSCSQLACRVGVTEGAIRQMERGQTKIASFVVGLRLARELQADAWYLATGNVLRRR